MNAITIDLGILLLMLTLCSGVTGLLTYFFTRKKDNIKRGREEGELSKDVEYIKSSVGNIEPQFKEAIDRIEKQFDKSIAIMEKKFESYDLAGLKTSVELQNKDITYIKDEIEKLREFKHEINNELNRIMSMILIEKK